MQRTRVKFACIRCHKQRRKCDGGTPCQNCEKRQSACTYPTENDRKPLNRQYINSLLKKIEALQAENETSDSSRRPTNFAVDSSVTRLLKSTKVEIRNLVSHNDVYKLDQDQNGLVTFAGPTSFRHMSVPPVINLPSKQRYTLSLNPGQYSREFEWFFSKINAELPVVDEKLFRDSLASDPVDVMQIHCYASDALVHAMLAIYMSRNGDSSYRTYKQLAMGQVMDDTDLAHITQVQTLLILTLVEMGKQMR